ncbi:MAG: phage terminase large subunit [Brasilonema angustatum HA4187-MV1]|jgi:predicted phage terminase large subunit-like protein|nr:phage terminase large subunit [Brasilonema angustatum HA4187-MV1]
MGILHKARIQSRKKIKRWEEAENISEFPELTESEKSQIDSFYKFFLGAWKVLHPTERLYENWHLLLLAEYLEEVYFNRIGNLLINVQPRSLKSELISVAFPCWVWIGKPEKDILGLSYSSVLANDHNQMRRDILKSEWYKRLNPGIELKIDKNRISEFSNNYKGTMYARGFDGSVTGIGGNLILVDDPNNPVTSESKQVRTETLRKFKDYSVGRRNDPKNTPIIVVQQRTNVEDVSGYILRELAEDYTYLKLPVRSPIAIDMKSPKDGRVIKHREPDELLHPERFGEKEDEEARRTLGAYMYASRYRQEPYAKGGGIFRSNWQYFTTLPKRFAPAISVDASFGSVTDTASYVVIQCWLICRPNFYLWSQQRERMTFPKTQEAIKKNLKQWGAELGKPITAKLVEAKANGAAIIQTLRADFPGIIGINPKSSKKARAEAIAPTFESKNVWLREGAAWLSEYEPELEAFPDYDSDDQVDATSQLIYYYLDKWRREDANQEYPTIGYSYGTR